MIDEYEKNYELMKTLGLCDKPTHFTEEAYENAVSKMQNEDGSSGAHFKIEDVEEIVRKKKDFSLGEYNIYDYAYALNMVYSDYYGAVDDKEEAYVKLADLFLFDKDGPKGKALVYYLAMKCAKEEQ